MEIAIEFGGETLTVDVATDRVIPVQRGQMPIPLPDPAGAVAQALELPWHYPPLRQALTPDDRVTIAIDEKLPGLPTLLTAVLDHMASAGVSPEAITLLCPPSTSTQDWVNDLPDRFEAAHVRTHNPADRKQLAYLATTRAGRRVYLNRSIVDADQLVVLAGVRVGETGAAGALFPAMSDLDARRPGDPSLSTGEWNGLNAAAQAEAEEVAWLVGAPFFVHIVDGPGDSISAVLAGANESTAEANKIRAQFWHGKADRLAGIVVAGMSGDPDRQDAGDMARALGHAARVVSPGGTIVLLCQTRPLLGPGLRRLMEEDSPDAASRALAATPSDDSLTVNSWIRAAQRARLVVHSGIAPEDIETMFATPLDDPRALKRVIERGGDCIFLSDAHKFLVTVGST